MIGEGRGKSAAFSLLLYAVGSAGLQSGRPGNYGIIQFLRTGASNVQMVKRGIAQRCVPG
jgi:hypothetical protein